MSVIFDTGKCKARLSGNFEKAQRALDAQVLKDSNYYVPFITGDLRDSSDVSKIGTGVIEWKIKYARKQYYDAPMKTLTYNPNARQKWFEVAKALKKKEWLELANAEYNK